MSKTLREVLAENNWDIGVLRPYLNEKGESVVTRHIPGRPKEYINRSGPAYDNYEIAPSTFQAINTKEEMIEIDHQTIRVAKFRLHITHTLLSYGGGVLKYEPEFNALAKTTLEWQTPDGGETETPFGPRPTFQLNALPLPITHSSTWKPDKEISPTNDPNYYMWAQVGARKTADAIEQAVLGVGKFPLYGLLNHPGRTQINLEDRPLIHQINEAIAQLEAKKFYGPYFVFHGSKHDATLDCDWPPDAIQPVFTQRDAVRGLTHDRDGEQKKVVIDCMRMDYADNDIAVVQATPDVVRIVVGLDITPVRWEDGYQTLAIIVPQIRADFHGNCGIAHLRKG